MKIGTKVKLTKKAVKKFYGTSKCGDMYFNYEPTLGQLIAAINSIEFNNGKLEGVVSGFGSFEDCIKVTFTGIFQTDYTYVNIKDLEVVK